MVKRRYNNKIPYTTPAIQQYHASRQLAMEEYKQGEVAYNKDDLNKCLFRSLCVNYLPQQKQIPIPEFDVNSNKTAVIVEFRILPHIEFIIRNTILKLGPSWSHTIVCGQYNSLFMTKICQSISPQINIVTTTLKNITQKEYSLFLTSSTFWNILKSDKILIYQEDSCIFKNNVDKFLKWDYIGAPFEERTERICVGNGGFSIRTRQIMLEAIATRPSLEERIITYNNKRPEDIYFCRTMVNYNIGKVADWDEAFSFSTENYVNINSFGGHQFWKNDSKWVNRMEQLMKSYYQSPPLFLDYYKYPILFNKYILRLQDPSSEVKYKLSNKGEHKSKYICAVHCYNLNSFDFMFSTILNTLQEHFTIIVTYCIESIVPINKNHNYTFISIPNYGMDIGSKFVITTYLKENKINYEYIFYIHSKSNNTKRVEYIKPFLVNLKEILNLCKDSTIGAFFNNCWIDYKTPIAKDIDINKLIEHLDLSSSESAWGPFKMYVKQILDYYSLPTNIGIFNEGNFYILHKKIAEELFTSKIIYNLLNKVDSFDYEWVNQKYQLRDHFFNVYKKYSEGGIAGNHLQTEMKLRGLSDNMIEHLFERIVMIYVKYKSKMKIKIFN